MILGIKCRWTDLFVNQVINFSSDVELYLALEDVNELFAQQINFLKGIPKTFHVHAPFRNIKGELIEFSNDFGVFKDCVMLGDAINKGKYHLVIHAKSINLVLIKELLKLSSKVILCFENLHNDFLTLPNDFINLPKNSRVGLCLDVCHCFIQGKNVFDEFINDFKNKMFHCHLADTGPNGEHGLQVGDGVIDFKHVFSRLKECPKNLVIIPEVTGSHLNENEGLIIAFKKLKEFN